MIAPNAKAFCVINTSGIVSLLNSTKYQTLNNGRRLMYFELKSDISMQTRKFENLSFKCRVLIRKNFGQSEHRAILQI